MKQLAIRRVHEHVAISGAHQTRVEYLVNVPDENALRARHHFRPDRERIQSRVGARHRQRLQSSLVSARREAGRRKESISEAEGRDPVRILTRASRNAVQHRPPVFGAHRNDEFVEVLIEQVLGPIHQPVEAVVDGEDVAAVVDDVGDVRRKTPRLDVDDASTSVLPQTRVHASVNRTVVELELLGSQQAADFDKFHQIRYRDVAC